jgi:hypothetical protein
VQWALGIVLVLAFAARPGSSSGKGASAMIDWIWQHIVGPAINGTFAIVPIWVWIIIAALALGWAWKTFGWQGLVPSVSRS